MRERSVLLSLGCVLFAIGLYPTFVVQVFDGVIFIYVFLRNLIEVGKLVLKLVFLGIL